MKPHAWLAAFCLLCGAALGAFDPSAGSELGRDFRSSYRQVAYQILDGQGFAAGEGLADRYPPGYPLLLAPVLALSRSTGASERLLLLALDLVFLWSGAVLLHAISRHIHDGRIASLSAWLWVTYPPIVLSLGRGLTELPFSVALFAMTLLLLKGGTWRLTMLAGLVCGIAMLIRPAGLALLAAAVIWLVIGPRRFARAGVFAAFAVLAVLPWEVFVYAKTGHVILLSTGGRDSMLDGLTWLARQKKTYRVVPENSERLLRSQQRFAEAAPRLAGVGDIAMLVRAEFRQRPRDTLTLFARKAARAWYATDSMRHERYLLVMQIPYLALAMLGGFCLLREPGSRQAALLLLTLVVCSWVLTVAVLSILRYMVPVMGLLFVCASHVPLRWVR